MRVSTSSKAYTWNRNPSGTAMITGLPRYLDLRTTGKRRRGSRLRLRYCLAANWAACGSLDEARDRPAV